MKVLPFKLPAAYKLLPGQTAAVSDVDTGGYDLMIGGVGFRLATDQQFPYLRSTEPTTTRRVDNSAEVGEQTLSALPWLKSQSSFHAGAGQMNLEAPFTAFQYQQEQIAHLRFDNSLGVDVWTPGQVSRLPDTTFSSFGFDVKAVVTGAVNGTDYAVIGGVRSLYMLTWNSGPDVAPTVTQIDMSPAVYGGINNITVTSLATDGVNYYALVALTVLGSTAGVLTYVVGGALGTTTAPTPLYDVATSSGAARKNLCPNPSIEVSTAGWSAYGFAGTTIAQSTAWSDLGTSALLVQSPVQGTPPVTWTFTGGQWVASGYTPSGAQINVATVVGQTYTFSAMIRQAGVSTYAPVALTAAGQTGAALAATSTTPARLSVTFTATATTTTVALVSIALRWTSGAFPVSEHAGQLQCFIDSVLVELAPSGTYFDGGTASATWDGTAGLSSSTLGGASPITAPGIVGWAKERLIACVANKVYELSGTAAAHTALPAAKYTHPISSFLFTDISESPTAILISGNGGSNSTIMKFQLDTSGVTPTLSGGATIAQLPLGETITSLGSYLGTYLAIGTSKGIRVGTFDTYTGNLVMGPLSVTTTSPVYGLAGRDRFVYVGYSNQQADGQTGLARIDLSQPIDAAGRLAWAPDLRPPTSAPTGLGTVLGVAVLPSASRLVFITSEGVHVEGNGPGSGGVAWLRTSRIRFATEELKLFKSGRLHGSLDSSTLTVTGIAPFGVSTNLGTFGFLSGSNDPGEFGLPTGLNPWIQLQFQLNGSSAVLNSYVAKALPAPTRQRIITMTVNCFRQETDRYGLDVTDPLLPRERYNAVKILESAGNEVRLVEFTNTGPIATLVVIDQIEYHSTSRPNIDDDFGGQLTFKLRETVGK